MIELELTAESEAVLLALCEKYQQRRDCGSPMSSAAYFGTVEDVRKLLPGLWNPPDVRDCCFELLEAGLLTGFEADNTLEEMELLKPAIIWYQQTGKRKFSEAIDTIGRIKDAILP